MHAFAPCTSLSAGFTCITLARLDLAGTFLHVQREVVHLRHGRTWLCLAVGPELAPPLPAPSGRASRGLDGVCTNSSPASYPPSLGSLLTVVNLPDPPEYPGTMAPCPCPSPTTRLTQTVIISSWHSRSKPDILQPLPTYPGTMAPCPRPCPPASPTSRSHKQLAAGTHVHMQQT